jgi:cytochrome P460
MINWRIKMRRILYAFLTFSISFFAYAGGNPEFVHFPESYKSDFTEYDTRNRSNGKQVAVLYANKTAIESASSGKLTEGSKIVMEIYKPKLGENDKPITGTDGLFVKGKFAAVAVMEKRTNWDVNFNSKERANDWGFAIYKPDGSPKDNNLDCASCHTPLSDSDFLFSHSSLLEFTK